MAGHGRSHQDGFSSHAAPGSSGACGKGRAAEAAPRSASCCCSSSRPAPRYWYYTRPAPQPQPPPGRGDFVATTPVVAPTAATGDIDITLNALGTVTSLATVTIRSQISGYLVNVAYQEGQIVKKGDLLAEIDSRPYELALAQAQGTLARDKALLRRRADRSQALPGPREDQRDPAPAARHPDLPGRRSTRPTSSPTRRRSTTQKLNIAYCHIVAPVSGRVGLRLVDQGNYVTPGDATGLVVITQLQPISVIFTVAEDNLPQIQKRLRAGAIASGDRLRPHRHHQAERRHAARRSTTRSTPPPAR